MLVIVLSKFWTLTTLSPMSMTSPSAPNLGALIQSPTRTRSLVETWIAATSESSVSRKTRMMIAAAAPRPESSSVG